MQLTAEAFWDWQTVGQCPVRLRLDRDSGPAHAVPNRKVPHVKKISGWWGGLGRRAKIVVAVVVVVLVLGVVGAVAGSPETEPTANATPSAAIASLPTEASPSSSPSGAEPTPEASLSPSPEASPSPSPSPAPAKAILKISGRGDKIVKFTAQDGPTYAKITGKGGGNFAVISYTGSTYGALLVNEIGSFSGSVYVDPGMNRFKVTSSGTWTIEVWPIISAKHWNGTAPLTGKGDSVFNLTGSASGITTIKNMSKSNFAVLVYAQDGEYLDLLVNEIGAYNGEVMLPDADPMVLVIQAVGGTWSFSAVEQ